MVFFSSMTDFLRSLLFGSFLSLLLLCIVCLDVSPAVASNTNDDVAQFDHPNLMLILASISANLPPSERITRISSHFLNSPYQANTLIGGPEESERLVADLGRFDCFTFLDVVEALRRSKRADDFIPQLIKVRYKNEHIGYLNRRHFFSDWVSTGLSEIIDVTEDIGQGSTVRVLKSLNKRSNDALWLEGLPVTVRTVTYLPSDKINENTLTQLRDGDYVGIYSDKSGLDVLHTGIIVKQRGSVILRHASSSPKNRAVVDSDLLSYMHGKKGLVVYRVRTSK
jgi:hypothetical protein